MEKKLSEDEEFKKLYMKLMKKRSDVILTDAKNVERLRGGKK